jgi:hypothetical protein
VLLEAVKELVKKLETLDERVLRLDRLIESEGESPQESKAT